MTEKPDKNIFERYSFLFLLALIALYFFMATYKLGHKSIWLDDALSLKDAQDLGDLRAFVLTHPTYYILLHFWMKWGSGEFYYRFLSVLIGSGSVVFIYLLGRKVFDLKTAVMAAFLFCISTRQLFYTQQIRFYSLYLFSSLMNMYFFVYLLEKKNIRSYIYYTASLGFALVADPISGAMLLPQNAFVFIHMWSDRRFIRRWLLLQALFLAGALFISVEIYYWVLFWLEAKEGKIQSADLSWSAIPSELADLIFYFKFRYDWAEILEKFFQWLFSALILVLGFLVVFKKKYRGYPLLLWLWVVLIFLAFFITTWVGFWIYYGKYLYFLSGPMLLLVAWSFTLLRRKSLILISLALFSLASLSLDYQFYKKSHIHGTDWRHLSEKILQSEYPDAPVIVYPKYFKFPLNYYLGREKYKDIDCWWVLMMKEGTIPENPVDVLEVYYNKYDFFWLLIKKESTYFKDYDKLEKHFEETGNLIYYKRYGNNILHGIKSPGKDNPGPRD